MPAGIFDTQITIERKSVTQDSTYGTETVEWIPLIALPGSPVVAVKLWAEVQDVMPSRSESVTQGLAVARNQVRLRVRYRTDIDSSMRVTVHKESDVIYQIVGGPAQVGGRRKTLEMVLEKFTTSGGAV